MKNKLIYSLLIIWITLVFSGCCRDCLITNRELSSFKTYKDNGSEFVKIGSGWKFVTLKLNKNEGIASYSISENSILNKLYSQSVSETYFKIKNNAYIPLIFEPVNYNLNGNNKLEYLNYTQDGQISDKRKVTMNLDNGDLYLQEEVNNTGNATVNIRQDDSLNLKGGGYLLVPLSILSNLKNGGWEFLENPKDKVDEKNIVKYDSYLLIHAVPGISIKLESNSGWFAYYRKNLLFIKKYNTMNEDNKRVNRLLNINVEDNNLLIKTLGIKKQIKPDKTNTENQCWTIVEIKNDIKNIQQAKEFYNDNEYKLKLLINRKVIY